MEIYSLVAMNSVYAHCESTTQYQSHKDIRMKSHTFTSAFLFQHRWLLNSQELPLMSKRPSPARDLVQHKDFNGGDSQRFAINITVSWCSLVVHQGPSESLSSGSDWINTQQTQFEHLFYQPCVV